MTEHQSALDDTLRKIGRNVLNFQRMEAMLKFLISRSRLEGIASDLRSNHEKSVDAVSRQTMGNLVKSFLDLVSTEPVDEEEATVEEIEEAWYSFAFRIESDQAFIEQRQAALSVVVEERNVLIHQLLGRYDLTSTESCRELSALLDAQAEKVRPEYEALRSLVFAFRKVSQEAVVAMEKSLITGSDTGHE